MSGINIWDLITTRFKAGEYVVLREVRNDAGFGASRSADGIAMNLWPSRGLELHGIEVKSSRSDWLRELKSPNKAEAIFKYCDRFWLITADDKVANLVEIPAAWGWIYQRKGKLYTGKEAPKLQPEPLSRGFIAAMLKRATNGLIHPDSIQEKLEEAREGTRLVMRNEITRTENELKGLKQEVAEFEKASGIKISNQYMHDSKDIGEAVKFILDGGPHKIKDQLLRLKEVSDKIQYTINSNIRALSNFYEKEKIQDS